MNLISGVRLKNLKVIPDERGRLTEILRDDDELFIKFGQAYITTAYPGVVKGWHYHKKQFDNFTCLLGMIKLVLYDQREDSSTAGTVNEFFIGTYNTVLVQIPPGVYHGFKCIDEKEAVVLNIPTEHYIHEDPDEFRVDPHDASIPYDWTRKDM
ncbi:dTDP-4-dehydrorhamnose 3,5-epimerase family protein [candidate division KSB1 bacterium]